MNKKLIISSALIASLALPFSVFAFNPGPPPNIVPGLTVGQLIDAIFSILWPAAVAFFIIMFVIAGFKFATAGGEPEAVKTARTSVIYGMVGVIVALIAWSIVFILRNMLPGV
mgnify:CR=1 FL=1